MIFDHNATLGEGTWIEKFEIRKKIGRGGFGVTYEAKEFHLTASEAKHGLRLVALKEFFPRGLARRIADSRVVPVDADGEERPDLAYFSAMTAFIREAQALMSVDHPNVVQIHQVFESHGTAYFAMPLLQGLSLHGRLKQVGTLSQGEIESVVLPLLDGIEAAHKEGIIHRDIKPENIMLQDRVNADVKRPVLIDFGAARITAVDETRHYSLSTYRGAPESRIYVTEGYSPPEQYNKSSDTNKPHPYNDVYSFCATLYRCITGIIPTEARERTHDIQCGRPDPVLPADKARSGEHSYSPALLSVIDWGMELNPANRPQSIAQLRDVLLGNAPIPDRAVTKMTKVRHGAPERPRPIEPELAAPTPHPSNAAPRASVSAFQPEERIDRLIHLCDREDARDVLTDKLRERIRMSRPKPPIMCILPGGTRQGHRGFLERIKEYEVRGQLPGIGPEHISLVMVSGKLAVDSPKALDISILRAIRENVKEPGMESFKDLQKWMVADDRRIFILALEPTTEAVRGKELQFLKNAATWLSAWVPKPTRQLFILITCVRYSAENRWLGPDPVVERARVVDIVSEFAAAPALDVPTPEILQLPELPSITREHVDLWLDHVAVRQLIGARLRKTIDELFEEREYWSMDDLRDRLSIN